MIFTVSRATSSVVGGGSGTKETVPSSKRAKTPSGKIEWRCGLSETNEEKR
jgi:hypothetical protein